MCKSVIGAVAFGAVILMLNPADGQAAVYASAGKPAAAAMPSMIEFADVLVRRVPRSVIVVRPYRPWVRRPHYGSIVAGVVIGTIIAAAIAGVPPPPPRPDLCWYWADRAHTRGYWDYC
ncbi:MAG TPA: hypothetical protein VNK52_04975 [Hyphomicrobiaceae bacterium]|nr:hypothetical protein [Hyphomicrobiaceae bacterium]